MTHLPFGLAGFRKEAGLGTHDCFVYTEILALGLDGEVGIFVVSVETAWYVSK